MTHPWQDTRCFGSTTLGPRGQVVVPASARKELNLASGDSFLVFKFFEGKGMLFLKANEIEHVFEKMSQQIAQFQAQVKNAIAEEEAPNNPHEHD